MGRGVVARTWYDLDQAYQGDGAVAVAMGATRLTHEEWYNLPPAFHARVLYAQNVALLEHAAMNTGTTGAEIAAKWRKLNGV